MGDVVKLALCDEMLVVPGDQVLEAAKGEYVKLALVGMTADGTIQVAGTHSAAESNLLFAWAQNFIVANLVQR